MEQICLNNAPEIAGAAVTTLVTVMSILANFVKADGIIGKAIHFLAINLTAKK